jgi:hypothetical protein
MVQQPCPGAPHCQGDGDAQDVVAGWPAGMRVGVQVLEVLANSRLTGGCGAVEAAAGVMGLWVPVEALELWSAASQLVIRHLVLPLPCSYRPLRRHGNHDAMTSSPCCASLPQCRMYTKV